MIVGIEFRQNGKTAHTIKCDPENTIPETLIIEVSKERVITEADEQEHERLAAKLRKFLKKVGA